MATNANAVTISGRLGRDAELRTTPKGMPVVSFSVCVNTRKRAGDGWEDKPNWVPCVMFGEYAADISSKLVKGDLVIIQGRLNESSWDKDGQHHSRLEVVVDQIAKTIPRQQAPIPAPQAPAPAQSAPAPQAPALYDTEIPF